MFQVRLLSRSCWLAASIIAVCTAVCSASLTAATAAPAHARARSAPGQHHDDGFWAFQERFFRAHFAGEWRRDCFRLQLHQQIDEVGLYGGHSLTGEPFTLSALMVSEIDNVESTSDGPGTGAPVKLEAAILIAVIQTQQKFSTFVGVTVSDGVRHVLVALNDDPVLERYAAEGDVTLDPPCGPDPLPPLPADFCSGPPCGEPGGHMIDQGCMDRAAAAFGAATTAACVEFRAANARAKMDLDNAIAGCRSRFFWVVFVGALFGGPPGALAGGLLEGGGRDSPLDKCLDEANRAYAKALDANLMAYTAARAAARDAYDAAIGKCCVEC